MGPDLASDCSRCFGYCSTALPVRRSADFAFGKPADTPCRHLGPSYGCGPTPPCAPTG